MQQVSQSVKDSILNHSVAHWAAHGGPPTVDLIPPLRSWLVSQGARGLEDGQHGTAIESSSDEEPAASPRSQVSKRTVRPDDSQSTAGSAKKRKTAKKDALGDDID